MKRLIAASPALLGGLAAALVTTAGVAVAGWRITSDEVVVTARTTTLSPGNRPVAVADGDRVTVSWEPTPSVDGYQITRYDLAGAPQTPAGGCEGTVVTATCADPHVPVGSWRYAVVPVKGAWTGPESAKSEAVVVGAPDDRPGPTPTGAPAPPVTVPEAPPPLEAATSAPTCTLRAGADRRPGPGDTLTCAGPEPVDPATLVEGWTGEPRPVTVRATAGRHAQLAVVDAGGALLLGPVTLARHAVREDATFPATLTAADGRIVVRLDGPSDGPALESATTGPATPAPSATATHEPPPYQP